MDVHIRCSADSVSDYEAVGRIIEAAQADYPVTVDELRSRNEARRAVGLVSELLLAEVDARAVGCLGYGHMVMAADGDVFTIGLWVDPAECGNGIGRALHQAMLNAAARAGITRVLAFVDERQSRGIQFAEAAGYRDVGRNWESTINPQRFVAGSLRSEVDRVVGSGVALVPLAELKAGHPDWMERLYGLYAAIEEDIPFPVAERPNPFAVFRSEVIDSGVAIPEAFFIAVDGDEWVGLTEFRREREPRSLSQALTGVVRSHRRRGIAIALKVAGLEWARAVGCDRVRTWNHSRNAGMLAVNAKLGLARSHAVIMYLLEVDG